MPLDMVLKMLEDEFNKMTELFEDPEWQFFKFGQGGSWKRTLTHLQEKSNKYDPKIFESFGAHEETASFAKLVGLSLSAVKTPKERYKEVDTFRRQIKRMRTQL